MLNTFGEYQLVETLGRGGAAMVYRAWGPERPDRPREVALKFLHEALLDDDLAQLAFRWEGRLGLLIQHPNLVRTYGFEIAEGQTALVLECVEGVSLLALHHQLLHAPWLIQDQYVVAQLVGQICRGLGALHEARDDEGSLLRCVHRDVSLGNVIVDVDGCAKVIDLGVAFAEGRVLRTATGLVKGKLAYMAPEYLQGRAWDHRLDVWSAGVVLWEMATGRRLFRGSTPSATVAAVLSADVPDPRVLRHEISPALSAIVRVALDRRPTRRFANMAEMAGELEALAARTGNADPAAVRAWMSRLPLGPSSGVRRVVRAELPLDPREESTRSLPTKIAGV